MDVADRELERMIERRSRNGKADPDEQEELWKTSVAAHNARRREENRRAWASYHEAQAGRHRRTLEDLISRHEARAARLSETEAKEGA